jgi:type II restriction enzyme
VKLELDISKAEGYESKSQIARVLTENWVKSNIYCLNCGQDNLSSFENNQPVADFYCARCKEQFELKSKSGGIARKIIDGAYQSMIARISSVENPNFFFLNYDKKHFSIVNFLIIPKHFFIPRVIEKRKPLPLSARRAGWVGCNILLNAIPETGRIFYIRERQPLPKENVMQQWQKTVFLRKETPQSRGWLLDTLACIEKIPGKEFQLADIYAFEKELQALHPENNFIRDKIRQQLQVLRDKGLIEFTSRGCYCKL